MARDFLEPAPPRLLAIGGFSGSGKSTLARALAPSIGRAPGAVVIRSDEVRKALHGVPTLQRLGPDGYTPEVTERVYRTVERRAAEILRGGQSVIADAVFGRPSDRVAIEHVAAAAAVSFLGFWLEASPAVLMARVDTRRADPSDADASIIRRQIAQDPGSLTWHRLDAGVAPEAVTAQAYTVAAKQFP